ncbi:hypothetical protein ASF32_00010 [Methylobacterium sp. Leaf91]|nr:hypothetical protein ASF32_00010 [Methylobacterium sp. Leaf91]
MSDALLLLTLATENAELRAQLAEVQEQCVELAVDAGELHAEVERLQWRLAVAERDRDRWQARAAPC